MLSEALINEILQRRSEQAHLASELGFFSKPFRVKTSSGKDYILKLYRPVRSEKKANAIIGLHEAYIKELRNIGISVPETKIFAYPENGKHRLAIIQSAFEEDELVRSKMEKAAPEVVLALLTQLLDNTVLFLKKKPENQFIGFHPTLRNYALSQGQLHYFDTFPPMLLPQRELNRLILEMTPAKFRPDALIPLRLLNRVSDEYYQAGKMLTGIIGSCCRLRPDIHEDILQLGREYIAETEVLSEREKSQTLQILSQPPRLSGLWIFFRKLFGKTGKPNI